MLARRGLKNICQYLKSSSQCRSKSSNSSTDVVVVGAGHNGLVAATLLGRQGLKVKVLEEKTIVGGACRTEYPFSNVPGLGQSTGAYLLGVMPPELLKMLGLKVRTMRRDPHYFLPTMQDRYLLLGSDVSDAQSQFKKFFSEQDWLANQQLNAELAALREALACTWLKEPSSIEDTAERHVPAHLRDVFIDLCRKPVSNYIDRFGFKSDLLRAMYAVTDGFSGLNGSWDTPGTGMNFLVHNMCRLPGADGTWMVVEGGMGSVTQQLAALAAAEGVEIETGCKVEEVLVEGAVCTGVKLVGGSEVRGKAVIANADPFRLQNIAGQHFPAAFGQWVDSLRKDGTTMKVNMALKDLPRFTCLPEKRGQHNTTIHLLPEEAHVMRELSKGFEDVQNGHLPEFPTIEWYIHTPVDPSLQDSKGHHSSALFVQWVPYQLKGTTWEQEEDRYVKHLLSIVDRFAPGTSGLVADTFTLTPPKIEEHFGITRGHIHHVDNSFGFDERYPYRTPLAGLYSCSAGCHPAGSVIGCAGHNAAGVVVRDMGCVPVWPTA